MSRRCLTSDVMSSFNSFEDETDVISLNGIQQTVYLTFNSFEDETLLAKAKRWDRGQ